jgi:uncharacterized repeat protein (TIGR03803 family)
VWGATALILWTTAAVASAQTYTALYSFRNTDGCCADYPSLLAQGRDGNLYGTTTSGGTMGWGNAFVMTPAGAVTPIYNFDFVNGGHPQGGLSLGFDGNFYGTTYQGGAGSAGTVFRITPGGVLTVLHSFTNGTDGAFPRTPPVQAGDGNLYGVTGNGTVAVLYRIAPSGTFTVMLNVPSQSYTPLIVATDGLLYGMTQFGGTLNRGTIFQYTPAKNKLKIIHSFDPSTGQIPSGPLMQAKDGKLYGTTTSGGAFGVGAVFQVTTTGKYVLLHSFDSTNSTEGSTPYAGVVQGSDLFLYGVASAGGVLGHGTLFRLSTKGTGFIVLHDFDLQSGDTPVDTPMLHTNGTIYGLTFHGGTFTVYGAAYSFEAGLKPFVSPFVFASGRVGDTISILGDGFLSASSVKFGLGSVPFTVVTDHFITATIDTGATTGVITVTEPGGKLTSPHSFAVIPTISGFAPQSGPVGTQVVITGTSLLQTKTVVIGKALATFTVNSDTQITATVGAGAVTGKVSLKTPGGSVTAVGTFTVQ